MSLVTKSRDEEVAGTELCLVWADWTRNLICGCSWTLTSTSFLSSRRVSVAGKPSSGLSTSRLYLATDWIRLVFVPALCLNSIGESPLEAFPQAVLKLNFSPTSFWHFDYRLFRWVFRSFTISLWNLFCRLLVCRKNWIKVRELIWYLFTTSVCSCFHSLKKSGRNDEP